MPVFTFLVTSRGSWLPLHAESLWKKNMMLLKWARGGERTLLRGLEIHRFHHHEIMPVDLGVSHTLALFLLLFLLPLTLLKLGPLDSVARLQGTPAKKTRVLVRGGHRKNKTTLLLQDLGKFPFFVKIQGSLWKRSNYTSKSALGSISLSGSKRQKWKKSISIGWYIEARNNGNSREDF